MATKKDRISEALGTQTGLPTAAPAQEMVEAPSKDLATISEGMRDEMVKNRATDYKTARENTKKLISEGMAIVPEMFDMVRESENPKMYDSAAGFMRTLLDLNKGLLALSDEPYEPKSKRKTPEPSPQPEEQKNQVQQTNVYITTESMLDRVASKGKKPSGPAIEADFKEVKDD